MEGRSDVGGRSNVRHRADSQTTNGSREFRIVSPLFPDSETVFIWLVTLLAFRGEFLGMGSR
eukprot:3158709-Rhodomonas_salina.1